MVPRRRNTLELLDRPQQVIADLPANLADLRFLNRWFGGTALAVEAVERLATGCESFSLLDVATGSADIPVTLCRRATVNGRTIAVTGLDISDEVLQEARAMASGYPIRLSLGDARALPYPPGSFDIVLCCLALHHFGEPQAVQVLREMWRVCRVGIVATDLTRGYLAYAGTWLVTHTLARSRLTRHDGPLSVLRSYTPRELGTLAHDAGISGANVRRHPLFRQVLLASKGVP